MQNVHPLKLQVSQTALADPHQRLDNTRWPNQLPVDDWSWGVPVSYVKELAAYWRYSFDWRKQEADLNRFSQFVTQIDGQDIHFIHVRSTVPDARPLLLCHGYPGSVVDFFIKVIEPLTNPAASEPAFHVVAISLPGLGLSPTVTEVGWNLMRTTHAFAALISQLGYERFGVQAGDAGAGIASLLGVLYPKRIIGIQLNGPEPTAEKFDILASANDLSTTDQIRLERMNAFTREGTGNQAIQSTRPYTIGYGLHDSPVMQLAWIVEKYKEWIDPRKALPEDAIDIDQMLTNVSLYWFKANGAGTANFIYENMYPAPAAANQDWSAGGDGRSSWTSTESERQVIPMGVAMFAADKTIRWLVDRDGSMSHWPEFDKGGNFAMM
ncbi:epoxide hydrolase 1 [Spirosoma aureum]|uniref:Epoxide hydrolase 1 n=1 Tax=Spirosoma aureum TaxID=2692134 RepID=A0A6G9AW32_9BACT|nr:epoxide hydrolase [Spirosoma aureum]QIP16539.1 epoxide hydrolase 1 [Spirosoma aureum]